MNAAPLIERELRAESRRPVNFWLQGNTQVTPKSERQLILGRLWGIGCHYIPAIVVLVLGTIGGRMLGLLGARHESVSWLLPNPLAFGCLMVVGLYLSLERLNFLLATLVAWTITFVLPSALALALNRIAGLGITISIAVVGLIQVGLAAAAWARLKCSVRERTFLKPND